MVFEHVENEYLLHALSSELSERMTKKEYKSMVRLC